MKAIKKYIRMQRVTNERNSINSITDELPNHAAGGGGNGAGLSDPRRAVLTRYSKAKD